MNKSAFFALMLALGLVGGCGNKKEEKKEEKDLARISQKPVSYTHLDVYKRQ